MRLGHIIVSVSKLLEIKLFFCYIIRPACTSNRLTHFVNRIVNNAGGHSGEVIPVPIPNTEVKLSYVDDTAFVVGK